MTTLEIRDLHVTSVSADDAPRSSRASTSPSRPARPTRSWARTARASRRWRTRSPATRSTPSPAARSPLDGADVLAMTVDERARAGLFLAMQYPVEVPGVSVSNFLRTAATAVRGEAPKLRTWVKEVNDRHGRARAWTRPSPSATSTRASPAARRSATRSCSSSCSSRRSRSSTRPTPASTSTRCASSARASTGSAATGIGTLLITHYTRILRYIEPDFVHVFFDGRIVESGGPELADQLEAEGYARFGVERDRRAA